MFSLLAPELKPATLFEAFLVLVTIVLMFVQLALDVISPIMNKNLVDLLTKAVVLNAGQVEDDNTVPAAAPCGRRSLLDQGSTELQELSSQIYTALILFIATQLGPQLAAILKNQTFQMIALNMTCRVDWRAFTHIHRQSMHFHLNRQTGQVIRAIDIGVSALPPLINVLIFKLFQTFLETAAMTTVLLKLGYLPIFLTVTTSITLLAAWFGGLTGLRNRLQRRSNNAYVELEQTATESILNYETIKLFGSEELEATRYWHVQQAWLGYELINKWVSEVMTSSGGFTIRQLGFGGALTIACGNVIRGKSTVGDYVMVSTYVMKLFNPLAMLTHQCVNRSPSAPDTGSGLLSCDLISPNVCVCTHLTPPAAVWQVCGSDKEPCTCRGMRPECGTSLRHTFTAPVHVSGSLHRSIWQLT